MEPRPDLNELCCVNPECPLYAQRGADNLTVRKIYGKDQIRYLRCRSCGEEFSERKDTAWVNLKIPEAKAADIIDHLDAGCGVVSTAQLTRVAKDTVSRLIRVTGRTSRRTHDQRVRNLTPKALQFDERWPYTGKKQRHLPPQDDPTQAGDHWDVNSLDPQTKLIISLVPGPRTAQALKQGGKMPLPDWLPTLPNRPSSPMENPPIQLSSCAPLATPTPLLVERERVVPPHPSCASHRTWSMRKWSRPDEGDGWSG